MVRGKRGGSGGGRHSGALDVTARGLPLGASLRSRPSTWHDFTSRHGSAHRFAGAPRNRDTANCRRLGPIGPRSVSDVLTCSRTPNPTHYTQRTTRIASPHHPPRAPLPVHEPSTLYCLCRYVLQIGLSQDGNRLRWPPTESLATQGCVLKRRQ